MNEIRREEKGDLIGGEKRGDKGRGGKRKGREMGRRAYWEVRMR